MVKNGKLYSQNATHRKALTTQLVDIVGDEEQILFAYLHGSIVEGKAFRDVDVAIYLVDMPKREMIEFELIFEEKIQTELKIPVDLKVLNFAPPHFSYMVIKKGIILVPYFSSICG